MVSMLDKVTGFGYESISQGLQVTAATLFDFGGALGQGGEEVIDLLAHVGSLSKTGIGSHVLTDPVPDGFVGIEVGAVAGQGDQRQVQIRSRQVAAHLGSAMG